MVSRVEHQGCANSGVELLAAQIDAAVNAGNSGGPVLASGRVVGVAYQGLGGLLSLPEGRSGLLVTALVPGSDAARVLRPRDVITSIDGKAIENDKNVEFRPQERTGYRLLCDPLTKNLLSSLGWRDAPPELLAAAYRNGDAQEPVRELVVLQRVLADEVNRGYDNLEPEIVKTIDGVRPRDLARALELAEGGTAPYLSAELEPGRLVVLERTAVRRRQENILKT